jgi:hypothetical protein
VISNLYAVRTGSSKRTLERHSVLLDALDGPVRNDSLAVLEDGRDVDFLPADRGLWGSARPIGGG